MPEFASLLVTYMHLMIQALNNVLKLFLTTNVNSQNLWGMVYGAIVTNYHAANAASDLLTATKNSTAALNNLSQAVSYLGGNASRVFGDVSGTRGLSAIQREAVDMLKHSSKVEDLAKDLSDALTTVIYLATKLLQSVEYTFR